MNMQKKLTTSKLIVYNDKMLTYNMIKLKWHGYLSL